MKDPDVKPCDLGVLWAAFN